MKLCLRYPATCPMAVLQWQFVYLLVLQWFWPPNMIMFDDSVLGGFPHFVQFTNPLDPCLLPGWTNPLPKLCEPPNMVGLTQISRQQPETCFTAWLPFCLFDFGDEVPIFCWQFPWYKYAARSSPDSWCKANFHYPRFYQLDPSLISPAAAHNERFTAVRLASPAPEIRQCVIPREGAIPGTQVGGTYHI